MTEKVTNMAIAKASLGVKIFLRVMYAIVMFLGILMLAHLEQMSLPVATEEEL